MRAGALRFIFAIAFAAMTTLSALAEDALPDGDGKDIVAAVCVECHDLSFVTEARNTPGQWRDIVTMMFDQGAPLEDYEIDIVVQYLAKHFGLPGT